MVKSLPSFVTFFSILVPLAMFLSGCQSSVRTIVPDGPQIPASLLICSPKPPAPEGNITQRDVALYVVKLKAALLNCQGNLETIKDLLEKYEARLADLKEQQDAKM